MDTDRIGAIAQTLQEHEQAERAAGETFARFTPALYAQLEYLTAQLRERGAPIGAPERRPLDEERQILTFTWAGGLACSLEPSAVVALPHPEDYQAPPHAGEQKETPAGRMVVFVHPHGATEPAVVIAAFHVFAAGWSGPGAAAPALGAFDDAAMREAALTILELLASLGAHFSGLREEQLDVPVSDKPPLGFRLRTSDSAPLIS